MGLCRMFLKFKENNSSHGQCGSIGWSPYTTEKGVCWFPVQGAHLGPFGGWGAYERQPMDVSLSC